MSVRETLRKALIADPSEGQNPDPNEEKEEAGVFERLKRRLIETDDRKPQPGAGPFVASPPPQPPPSANTPPASTIQPPTAPGPSSAKQPSPLPSWIPNLQPLPAQQAGGQPASVASPPSTTQGSTAVQVTGTSASTSVTAGGGASSSGSTPSAPATTPPTGLGPRPFNPPPVAAAGPEGPPGQGAQAPNPGPDPVKISFAAIYEAAGYSPVQFTAEKMLDMLVRLPPELSTDQKQLTVVATLEAMGRDLGATSETIVADARGKVAILISHVDKLSAQTRQFVGDTSAEIAALQSRIEEKRNAIEEAQRKEAETSQACQVEANRLLSILKFFGADTTTPNTP